MPLYEYKCTQCGATVESIQRVSDAPLTVCSQCGGPLHKLISSPAIQFKGSGWYITDYARKETGTQKTKAKSPAAGSTQTGNQGTEKTKESAPAEKSQASTPSS